jgi:hypothetical protein
LLFEGEVAGYTWSVSSKRYRGVFAQTRISSFKRRETMRHLATILLAAVLFAGSAAAGPGPSFPLSRRN